MIYVFSPQYLKEEGIFFIKQHGKTRSKLSAQELLGIKYTKKLGGEVCTEYIHTVGNERFLEMNGSFSAGTQAEVLPKLPQNSPPRRGAPAHPGE